jgi:hypothetical protein
MLDAAQQHEPEPEAHPRVRVISGTCDGKSLTQIVWQYWECLEDFCSVSTLRRQIRQGGNALARKRDRDYWSGLDEEDHKSTMACMKRSRCQVGDVENQVGGGAILMVEDYPATR